MTNLPATLSTLDQQISALTEKLAPAKQDHISDAMASMLKAGMSLPSSIDPNDAMNVYWFAMSGVCVAGVRRATMKLIRGEYDIRNKAFIPLPPDFATMARAETRTLADDQARLRDMRRSMTDRPEPRSPEMVARAKELVARWREGEAVRRSAQSPIPQEHMSEERAAYFAQIMALRDRKDGLDASQMAFRRKIQSDMAQVAPEERQAAE